MTEMEKYTRASIMAQREIDRLRGELVGARIAALEEAATHLETKCSGSWDVKLIAAEIRALKMARVEAGRTESEEDHLGKRNAEAVIEGDEIVIRLPINVIEHAYSAGVDAGAIRPGFRVTDARMFAPEVVRALNDEDEEGTTPIHHLFDDAFTEAIEQGAEGVEEDPVCERCCLPQRTCICGGEVAP
jgi:hypothetical protein